MKEEIAAAVFFVARLAKRHGSLDAESREEFAAALTSALFDTYKTHWYPHTPVKGQAYRCLRMNRAQLRDPVLERACLRSAVCYEDLGLPQEMTIWVDPGEVSCRLLRRGGRGHQHEQQLQQPIHSLPCPQPETQNHPNSQQPQQCLPSN